MNLYVKNFLLVLIALVLVQETVSLVGLKHYKRYFANTEILGPVEIYTTGKQVTCVIKFHMNSASNVSYFRYIPQDQVCVIGALNTTQDATSATNDSESIPIMVNPSLLKR